jgi:holo-[acyl-carrier protein] synthase
VILGLGIDVCAITRMEDSLRRFGDRIWERVLSEPERRSLEHRADRATALAGRFAAKEAVVKALAGAPGVGWHDLEVRGAPRRPPELALHGPARALAARLGVRRIHLSITHDGGIAAAVVILEGARKRRPPPARAKDASSTARGGGRRDKDGAADPRAGIRASRPSTKEPSP